MARPRYLLAFALAPAVPALLWGVYLLALGVLSGGGDLFLNAMRIVVFVGLIAYAHAIVLGIPVSILMARLGWLSPIRVLGASALIGAVPATIWFAYPEFGDSTSSYWANGVALQIDGKLTFDGWINHVSDTLQFAASGAAGGLAWWWISGASSTSHPRPTAV